MKGKLSGDLKKNATGKRRIKRKEAKSHSMTEISLEKSKNFRIKRCQAIISQESERKI